MLLLKPLVALPKVLPTDNCYVMVAFSKVNVMSFVGTFLVKAQMFGKFLKLMVAVTYKEHFIEHLYV